MIKVALGSTVVAITTEDRVIVTITETVEIPEVYLQEAERRGLAETTVGSVVAEVLGGDPADPHSALTNSTISRRDILYRTLVSVLRLI